MPLCDDLEFEDDSNFHAHANPRPSTPGPPSTPARFSNRTPDPLQELRLPYNINVAGMSYTETADVPNTFDTTSQTEEEGESHNGILRTTSQATLNASISQDQSAFSLLDHSLLCPENLREWTNSEKENIQGFATAICVEYGVPDSLQEDFIEKAQLPTHKLVVAMWARMLRDRIDVSDATATAYFKGRQYKQFVVAKLHATFMNEDLPFYKNDLTARWVRHIRLHSADYRIPDSLVDYLTTQEFATAISASLGALRGEYKRKLTKGWKNKTNIYTLVGQLIGKPSVEPSVKMWGRWAWVQMKLEDFQELVSKGEQRASKFWDWLDEQLQKRRDKYKQITNTEERRKSISKVFELALTKHVRLCPGGLQPRISGMSPWQKAIYKTIKEMQSYSEGDLAAEPSVDEDNVDGELEDITAAIRAEEAEDAPVAPVAP